MSIRSHGTGHAVGSREMAILVAVADAGSIRQAAMFLGLTPAAVSKTVRQAEARLGSHVFDRSAAGMVPTDAGHRLLGAGRHALHQLTTAQEDFRALNGSIVGHVRIGAGPYPAPSLARIAIPEANRRWPNLRITVELDSAERLIAGLRQGAYDVAICHLEDVALPEGVQTRILQRLRATLLVRQGHPLAGSGRVPASRLRGYQIAGFTPYTRFRRWYREQVGADADFALTGVNLDLLAQTVTCSDYLFLSSGYLAEHLGNAHGLVALDVDWQEFIHEVHCIEPASARSLASAAVVDLIHETMHQNED